MSEQVVKYKGRDYILVWKGTTKHGERAKLKFMDGSKEFWIDAEKIENAEPTQNEDVHTDF